MSNPEIVLLETDSRFIQVDIEFAREYGVNEAMVAAQLVSVQKWHSEGPGEYRSKWVAIDTEEWHTKVPLTQSQMWDAIDNLLSQEIILKKVVQERGKALIRHVYMVNPEMIEDRTQSNGKQEVQPQKRPGKVYLAETKTDQIIYKIGVSTNPDKRIKVLNTEGPYEIKILHTIECDDAYEAEAKLHNAFSDSRLNGEWFDLSDNQVTAIMNIQHYQQGEFIVEDGIGLDTEEAIDIIRYERARTRREAK